MTARGKILSRTFFARPALTVARELIGKSLVRRLAAETVRCTILETEAYIGPHDQACHAFRGRTARTEVMFGPAGCWYVYFIYGMHWMLNVVTDEAEYPAAVLIRSAGEWTGPGRLTRNLRIDRDLNGLTASRPTGLWIEDAGTTVPARKILKTPRIGVDYAAEWAARPYRFVAK